MQLDKGTIAKNSSSSWIILLLVVAIFTKELFTRMVGGVMVDFFGYLFFSVYFALNLPRIRFSRYFLYALIFWTLCSLLSILWLDLPFFPFLKQLIPIVIIYFSSYDIIYRRGYSLSEIMDVYLKVSLWVAIFGIIQWSLSVFWGINILIKAPGLLDSITYEPSHYAVVVVPAAVYSLLYYHAYRKTALVLVLSLLLTFSFTAYLVMAVALLIPRIRLATIPVLAVVTVGLFALLPYLHPRIQERVEGVQQLFEFQDYNRPLLNGTVVSFASNFDVALYSSKTSPLWGSGLGGHETMYYRYFEGKPFRYNYYFGINYNSAHALTIRILSEAGILGLFLFVLFLAKAYIKKRKDPVLFMHHAISLACISHFIAKSLKLGGYIDYGTPFFFSVLLINLLAYRAYLHGKST